MMGSAAVQLLWRDSYKDWSLNMYFSNCSEDNPSRSVMFYALLLLFAYPQPGEHTPPRLISSYSDLSYLLIRAAAIEASIP